MPIKTNINIDELFERAYKQVDELVEGIIEAMRLACNEVIEQAKMTDTYKDRTNNLRSSIGYIIYHGGEQVAQSFGAAGNGTEGTGASGVSAGKAAAAEAAQMHPADIVAVLVAGEHYALYVESMGLDVITGSTKELKQVVEKYLRDVYNAFR